MVAGISSERLGVSWLQRDQTIKRAHDVPDGVGGDARIQRGRVELGVSQQNLDHPDIDVLFEEVGGEAVPERMRRNALVISAMLAAAWQARLSWRADIGLIGSRPGNSQT